MQRVFYNITLWSEIATSFFMRVTLHLLSQTIQRVSLAYSAQTSHGYIIALESSFYQSQMSFCYSEVETSHFSCSDNTLLRVRFVECDFIFVRVYKYGDHAISSAVNSGRLYLDVLESKFYCNYACIHGEVKNGGTMYISIVDSELTGSNTFRTNYGSRNIIQANITRCKFSTETQALDTGSLYFGLTSNFKSDMLSVSVDDSNFQSGSKPGIVCVIPAGTIFHLRITKCKFNNNHLQLIHLRMFIPQLTSIRYLGKTSIYIHIDESVFVNNNGDKALLFFSLDTYDKLLFNLTLTNSVFKNNLVKSVAISAKSTLSPTSHNFFSRTTARSVLVKNISFVNNSDNPLRENAAIFQALNTENINLENTVFKGNTETPILAYFSDITLSGKTVFEGNVGYRGGAIALYYSVLYFNHFVVVIFQENFAKDVGGALFVKVLPTTVSDSPSNCFYHRKSHSFESNFTVEFDNNTSLNGGEDIYGAALKSSCKVNSIDSSLTSSEVVTKTKSFRFNGKEEYSGLSTISSAPRRVCLCDKHGIPQCDNLDYIYFITPARYPGERFSLSAVIVGYEFGTLSALIYSQLLSVEGRLIGKASLGLKAHIQEVVTFQKCSEIEYQIQSDVSETVHVLVLTASPAKILNYGNKSITQHLIKTYKQSNVIPEQLLSVPIYINVTLERCPLGYVLSDTRPYVCKCHPELEQKGIKRCVITNHTGWVYRSDKLWVSAISTSLDTDSNNTDDFVIHQFCPYNYCKQQNISINLMSPNKQCVFNHSGVLCGGCAENLSLVLGSSRCLQCDNKYIALLLVFALAGIILVFFIKLLDLTVAKGTISGLILYANIVWANRSIVFPATEALHTGLHILHTFIAWINLDLGIETCFIDGLNAYWKTMLQFVFPVYIWSIIGTVIIFSRYFTIASKIFGNNSVPVLATLFLLSYGKVLHSIIISLGFSLLEYPDGIKPVWSFDGNVPYFGAAHAILFIIALAVLLLLWLPYTSVLLSIQWLRRKTHLKPFRWIIRWKPLFDAYHGQLKPKHHYWVGILLLVRVLLFVLFSGTSTTLPQINILAIIVVGIGLLGYTSMTGFVYKLWYLSFLENSFIVNLIILASGTLYLEAVNKSTASVVYTSITIAFIQFILIVIYHIWCRLKSAYETHKRRHPNTDTSLEQRNADDTVRFRMHYSHYRESLLDSS